MMTFQESLEAGFGKYRVVVNGTDVRGYYDEDQAQKHVDHYNQRGHDAKVVVNRVKAKGKKQN